jgi:glycosyltransferase involved in cell wall biosynthesis
VPIEALACGAPVIALGRGGVAETVDDSVGRIYREPTSADLRAAIDAWEADGCPHDPTEARHRAEALSGPVFRDRILKLLAEIMTTGGGQHVVPPPPHLTLRDA